MDFWDFVDKGIDTIDKGADTYDRIKNGTSTTAEQAAQQTLSSVGLGSIPQTYLVGVAVAVSAGLIIYFITKR